jgi:AcrR family transcriptional regulator
LTKVRDLGGNGSVVTWKGWKSVTTPKSKRRRSVKKRPVTHARVRKSKSALRDALQSLLRCMPLEKISIRDIASGAAVGYTTFFRHYPTKESLLNDLAKDEIDRLLSLTTPMFDPDNTQPAALAFCEYIDESRELWSALLAGAVGTMREALIKGSQAMTTNYPRPVSWLPADLGTAIVVSSIIEILVWWLRQKKPMPVAQVAAILNRIAIYPISHE